MNVRELHTNVISVLPLAVALWLGYVLALTLIDHMFYPHPIFPPIYYLTNGVNALLVLGLLFWPQARAWLGNVLVPLIIGLLTVVPIVTSNLIGPGAPASPAGGPEGTMLRQMPLLLLALVLTAWQYGWSAVLLYTGGIGLFMLGFHLYIGGTIGAPLLPPVTVLIIQTVSFLVVGCFISTLIRQVRQQQATLVQANAQLTDYATTLEELTVSRERNRIARELHDTLAHTLSGLSVHLEMMQAYWEADPTAIRPMLDTALVTTRSGLQETRRALKHLRASPLDDLGLALALRQMATETAERANMQLDLVLPPQLPPLKSAVEQCLYRVAQEATANVAHHANAHKLCVELTAQGAAIRLRVQDDGCGFVPHEAPAAGHFGLAGMRERTELVGGRLTITSQPGQGTTVELYIKEL